MMRIIAPHRRFTPLGDACQRGHQQPEEGWPRSVNGHRFCRECRVAVSAAARARETATRPPRPSPSHPWRAALVYRQSEPPAAPPPHDCQMVAALRYEPTATVPVRVCLDCGTESPPFAPAG